MKFLFASYDERGAFGGPLEWLKRLGPSLRALGHEVHFAFLTAHDGAECETVKSLRAARFGCTWLCKSALTQFRDHTEARVEWFIRQAIDVRPDVFVANAVYEAVFAGRWVRASGIPTVVVNHSDDSYHESLCRGIGGDRNPFAPSAIVAVSEQLAEVWRDPVGTRTVVERIACGAPVPLEKVAAPGTGPLRLAYVGKFSEVQKRIGEVTRAFCRATREVPGTEAILFGDGPEADLVRAIIQEEAGGDRVKVGGKVPSASIQAELLRCHVIVLLSDFEGLPVALLEAMACGLVPVCLDIRSGIPELVLDRSTGLLVQDRGDSFVSAIRELRADEELWRDLSNRARGLVESRYSMPVVAEQWVQLGRSLVASAGPKERLKVPRSLDLPAVSPGFEGRGYRRPNLTQYLRNQADRVSRWLERASQRSA